MKIEPRQQLLVAEVAAGPREFLDVESTLSVSHERAAAKTAPRTGPQVAELAARL